ncbi:MAG TPA: hypothetical protein PKW30_06240 [Campylobacterales bacterium]|nr:hypothetical protein [Campylobacterales bacterium]
MAWIEFNGIAIQTENIIAIGEVSAKNNQVGFTIYLSTGQNINQTFCLEDFAIEVDKDDEYGEANAMISLEYEVNKVRTSLVKECCANIKAIF